MIPDSDLASHECSGLRLCVCARGRRDGRRNGRRAGRQDNRSDGRQDNRRNGRSHGRRDGCGDGRRDGRRSGRLHSDVRAYGSTSDLWIYTLQAVAIYCLIAKRAAGPKGGRSQPRKYCKCVTTPRASTL